MFLKVISMKNITKKTGYFKSFDDLEIYYETRGAGEVIVFIYGIACLMNHWHHQFKYFAPNYKTVCFDLRGHHKTARPHKDENLTLEALANDIKLLAQHLKVKKIHLVGHSFGAQVILKTYELYPEIVNSIVFINGFSKNPVKGMFGFDFVEKLYFFIKEKYTQNPQLWKTVWKLGIDNPLAVPVTSLAGGFNIKLTSLKDIQVYVKGVSNLDLGAFLKMFEELMTYDGDKVLSHIKVPTLIISGENDHVTPIKYQQKMHNEIPHSEFLLVPYGSHCTQLDFPEFVNLKIEKFYNTHF